MIHLKNYSQTDNSFNLYRVDLEELQFDKVETASKCKAIQEFVKMWGITVVMFVDICDKLAIQDCNLYDFYTYGKEELLVKRNAIYVNKEARYGWNTYVKKVFYDIYINTSQYIGVFLNKVAVVVMQERYPWMFKTPFIMEERIYPASLKPALKEPDNIQTHDLMHKYIDLGYLSLSEFINLFNHTTDVDTQKWASRFSIYGDGMIFLKLDEGQSIYLKIEDFDTNDFKAVEEREVCGYRKPDGTSYPLDTKQVDLHFFNHPLVEELRQHFKRKTDETDRK